MIKFKWPCLFHRYKFIDFLKEKGNAMDSDYEDRVKRFAEYDRKSKEMRKHRLSQMPWYKRILFITIGDIWDWATEKRKAKQ